ncbi:MAG: Rieske 2Fe-2S domain-containing protein [Pirellulales bacterium]|nr:Rieske 2Fe-2S domain-containing protein [Pirellulales bacterium]
MNRRSVLAALSAMMATATGALVAVPGVGYLFATAANNRGAGKTTQRVARLRDLLPDRPLRVPVIADRRDAWTRFPREAIGGVWLVRRSGEDVPAAQAQVDAFTEICPHLGCRVHHDTPNKQFVCPCHHARFRENGELVPAAELQQPNPAPRGLDALDCRLVEDPATKEWWVEVAYEKFVAGIPERIAAS